MKYTLVNKNRMLYWAYFVIICLYMILLRLRYFPKAASYLIYGLAIFIVAYTLTKKGLKRIENKPDVILILVFALYYFFSSLFFVSLGGSDSSGWLIRDWLCSLLPILFYVLFRLTRVKIDIRQLLYSTLLSILIIDIISLIAFFVPGSHLIRLFNENTFFGVTVAYVMPGIFGVIGSGFANVIAISICILSPINISKQLKFVIVGICLLCVYLSGQRTPIIGILLIIYFALRQYRGRGFGGILLALLFVVFLYSNIDIRAGDISVTDSMTERYYRRIQDALDGNSGRMNQQMVFGESLFTTLFGAGVGRYSPENPTALVSLQDAMLYRIYNEMGVCGLLCFVSFFCVLFVKTYRNKNYFMEFLVIYVFIANFFNRVLFAPPLSMIPYVLFASFIWLPVQCKGIWNDRSSLMMPRI